MADDENERTVPAVLLYTDDRHLQHLLPMVTAAAAVVAAADGCRRTGRSHNARGGAARVERAAESVRHVCGTGDGLPTDLRDALFSGRSVAAADGVIIAAA